MSKLILPALSPIYLLFNYPIAQIIHQGVTLDFHLSETHIQSIITISVQYHFLNTP